MRRPGFGVDARWAFGVLLAVVGLLANSTRAAAQDLELEPGERIVVIGNTFAERLALSGYFDALAHAAHPDHRLVIRHVPWSADEVGLRPREMNVPTPEDHLQQYEADVIVLCFGMSESFKGARGLDPFRADLQSLLDDLEAARLNGKSAPRLVLVSPIAHEDLGEPFLASDAVAQRNAALASYRDAMRETASARGHHFVDLFGPSARLYTESDRPLTSNGIHPTEYGYWALARELGLQLGWLSDDRAGEATPARVEAAKGLRQIAYDKHWHFRLLYRPTNTEYVWGRRHEPFGVVNFPPEQAQLERMIEARERAMWAMDKPPVNALFDEPPTGAAIWEEPPTPGWLPEDSWTPEPVEAKGTETSLGSIEILPPEEFAESFTLADGYEVECFASERNFADLQNPMAMTFDNRHRLWVLCTPTYPHLLPGESPRCKLLVLEDTDGDGRADKRTVFADRLYVPMGFAVDTDTVYVGQAPDLLKLTDTDGDGVADRRETIASGFAMPDSHHQTSAFEWGPGGGIMFHEGVFSRANVETPYGTRRTRDAAVWRFDPRTRRLEVMSHCGYANPWGHVFDDYGLSILADASGGSTYCFAQVIMPHAYPNKPNRPGHFHNRGRPTAGCELISSRHFPDDVQGTFLINQSIGFHGTRWDRVAPHGSGLKSEPMPKDLIQSDDVNFRPVAMEIGPDGALYIVDWCNPIVGHMQYSVRDPRRDHTHGRIWRVRHQSRPLLDPPDIAGATIEELLELLRLPERNTRQHVRRRLQRAPATDVFPALLAWIDALDPTDPLHDRLLLESLWIHQAHGRIDTAPLERLLEGKTPEARAGAVRVLRHWIVAGDVDASEAIALLQRAVVDEDMRVRLEAVTAAGFVEAPGAMAIVESAAELPMDEAFVVVLDETMAFLDRAGEGASSLARRLRLERTPTERLTTLDTDELVAETLIARPDAPIDRRTVAVEWLARAREQSRTECLVQVALSALDAEKARDAIAEMLLTLPAEELAASQGAIESMTRSSDRALRTLGLAAALRLSPRVPDQAKSNASLLVESLALLKPEHAPEDSPDALQRLVESGEAPASPAIEQIVRLTKRPADDIDNPMDDVFAWLIERVDAAETGFDAWNDSHVVGMAALAGLDRLDHWPPGHGSYRMPDPAPGQMEAGKIVYHDDAFGCARCHGDAGQGAEGFPALARSPWVLGDPRRAAAIVVHGMYGEIRMPGGKVFSSAMAPLGSNLDDQQVADVLTFVRRSWGNWASPVTADEVAEARAASPEDEPIWEASALLARYPLANDRLLATPVALASTSDQSATSRVTTAHTPPDSNAQPARGQSSGLLRAFLLTTLGIVLGGAVLTTILLRRTTAA